MSVDELLMAVEDLSEPDLVNLVNRALFLRARRKASVLSSEETVLLKIINQGIPKALQERYQLLAEKRDEELLSASENQELLSVGD